MQLELGAVNRIINRVGFKTFLECLLSKRKHFNFNEFINMIIFIH